MTIGAGISITKQCSLKHNIMWLRECNPISPHYCHYARGAETISQAIKPVGESYGKAGVNTTEFRQVVSHQHYGLWMAITGYETAMLPRRSSGKKKLWEQDQPAISCWLPHILCLMEANREGHKWGSCD